MIPPHIILALKERRATILSDYFNGIKEGFQFTKTEEYKRIPNYILSSGNREWLNHEFEHK